MRQPAASQVLGRVTLVTGKEEFLANRTVASVRNAVREYDAEAELSESAAGDLTEAGLNDMSAPSLFSATRCVVVTALEDASDDVADSLLAFAAAPVEEIALVVVHGGGQRGTGLLNKLRKLPSVTEIKTPEVKYASGCADFVAGEVALHGARIAPEAAGFLVQAIGQDLRSLAAAADQLVSDFGQGTIGLSQVQQYFGGRAEAKSFAVADAAFSGKTAAALEELRWAMDGGTASVLVTSAFAGSARGLARYLAAPRGMREGDLAREVGVPPWKLKTIRQQAQSWSPATIAEALRAVAHADADIKGQAHDASYALERLVLTISRLRASAR